MIIIINTFNCVFRTRVWTEPCLLQAAKQEYDNVIEDFLSVGEKLFGPYVWGRWGMLF